MAGMTFDLVLLSSSPPDSASNAPPEASPPPSERRVAMHAYSPISLSPPESAKQKASGALKSGSRAAPIPMEATRGFATVRSLVSSEHFAQVVDDDDLVDIQPAQPQKIPIDATTTESKATSKPRKRATKTAVGGESGDGELPKPKPKTRKTKANREEQSHNAASREPQLTTSYHFGHCAAEDSIEPSKSTPALPQTKPKTPKPRKPRAKKDNAKDCEQQTTLRKGRITKPKGATKAADKAQRKDTGIVSAHFRDDQDSRARDHTSKDHIGVIQDSDIHNPLQQDGSVWEVPQSPRRGSVPPKQRPPDPEDQTLDLDEAVLRRRDWTPPKDTNVSDVLEDSASRQRSPRLQGTENGGFTNMLSSFAYAPMDAAPSTTVSNHSAAGGSSIMKRRRIELVDIPGNQTSSRQSSPEKGKAPKKKPRTITDLVTGQYAPKDPVPDLSTTTGDFFEARTTTTNVPLNDLAPPKPEKGSAKPPRRRVSSKTSSDKGESKGESNSKSRKATAKSGVKPKMIADKLLSPASAVLKMNNQDILFGTSSQLAPDESPTMVRQIQDAIRASERDAEILPGLASIAVPKPPVWPRLVQVEGKRGLWNASSRDGGGRMLEKQDDVYMPEPDRTQDLPLLIDGTSKDPDAALTDIINSEPPVIQISSDLPTPPRSVSQDRVAPTIVVATHPATNDSSWDHIDDFAYDPPPSNQNFKSSFLDIDDSPSSTQPPPQSPQLPATFTGSPKKRRGRPPKSPSAIPSRLVSSSRKSKILPANPILLGASTRPSTPQKKKGRFADIEEILDSEDDEALSPTPPRTRKLEDSPPLPLSLVSNRQPLPAEHNDIVPIFRVLASQLEWSTIKTSVFREITSSIRALLPTTEPQKPSWHEKILMYDPIVLEDFTAFLNASTTTRTYKKATQKQVKAFNKAQKAKGEEVLTVRKGVDDDQVVNQEVLVVEKELETWMVQAWCQEMSICCITKENKGRGTARKGFY